MTFVTHLSETLTTEGYGYQRKIRFIEKVMPSKAHLYENAHLIE